jgi:hypothetical protein
MVRLWRHVHSAPIPVKPAHELHTEDGGKKNVARSLVILQLVQPAGYDCGSRVILSVVVQKT